MIELLDHKPKDALEALRSTRIAGLPDDINHQRDIARGARSGRAQAMGSGVST
jgi:hypothetical protein